MTAGGVRFLSIPARPEFQAIAKWSHFSFPNHIRDDNLLKLLILFLKKKIMATKQRLKEKMINGK